MLEAGNPLVVLEIHVAHTALLEECDGSAMAHGLNIDLTNNQTLQHKLTNT